MSISESADATGAIGMRWVLLGTLSANAAAVAGALVA
jgi:hypothetical protein